MNEDAHYRLLCLLEAEPDLPQRKIAKRLNVSLGKVDFYIRALADKGWVKVGNFYRSQNKHAYLYTLMPLGLVEKTAMTLRFLRHKEVEHRALLTEIEALRKEVNNKSGVVLKKAGNEKLVCCLL